ncbi:tam [Symbiodinium microadriaticum]|nr:tam [Symbiodinium sp. KB8]CAE7890761.1 tam [Symbiodinium microadriaticum]
MLVQAIHESFVTSEKEARSTLLLGVMAYRVEVECGSTGIGDQLAVVGGSPELGDWNPSKAIRLETSAATFPIWAAPIPAALLGCEFKFIILRSDGQITWEELRNRSWTQRAVGALPGAVLASSFNVDELQIRQPPTGQRIQLQRTDTLRTESDRTISFKATVSVSQVPHLGETDLKRDLWWSQEAHGGQSYVHQQPEKAEDMDAALQAMISCPTGSIRTNEPLSKTKEVLNTFPILVHEQLPRVFHLGYHSPKSFGAASYFLAGGQSGSPFNVMYDSPRYSSRLAKVLEAAGGIHLMVLSHKDDVADHERWKERFPGMTRVMHKQDVRGPLSWPYIDMTGVEMQLEGAGPWTLAEGLKVVFTPGHSAGCITLIADGSRTGGDGVAFTGDHLALSGRLGRLDGFARYSEDTELQADSMLKLKGEDVLWILPGHGRRIRFEDPASREQQLQRAAQEYRDDPRGQMDFAEFLKVRLALANEYKEAVKHQRLRASGSWDIQDPTLRQESRRGLGLGRIKLRQNNTRAYLASVVNEQSRQRREANWAPSFQLDDVKLSEVARKISKSDVEYSVQRAERDYVDVCKEIELLKKLQEEVEDEPCCMEQMEQPEQEPNPPTSESDGSDQGSPAGGGFGMKRVPSVALVDREEEQGDEDDDGASVASSVRPPDHTKGFGISKEVLHDHGLRATGRKDDSVCESSNRRSMSHTDLANAKTLR